MENLTQGKAQIIFTAAGQRVVKNVEGSTSRYSSAYNEKSKKAEVFILTQEDKNDIATKLISELIEVDVQVQINSDEHWDNITTKFWKELTYGDKFPELACDGSGEFGHGVCKFKLIEQEQIEE